MVNDSMKKVQEEIRRSIGNKGIVNEDDIQNMPYFKAMIKETFRLYPPGISLGVTTVNLILSNLLYAFDWELPYGMMKEEIDTDGLPGLVMNKKNALCLVPKNYLYT
ncbi:hypothetical protein RDI58_001399 [Solanum bulbocastanum]|uniref:Cytochrome P450 n=1 Tax=Solanum bulbocastanum TaxID=147425 RepID=A0AAN8UBU1_SOLBU